MVSQSQKSKWKWALSTMNDFIRSPFVDRGDGRCQPHGARSPRHSCIRSPFVDRGDGRCQPLGARSPRHSCIRSPFVDREISLTEGMAGASRAAPGRHDIRVFVPYSLTEGCRCQPHGARSPRHSFIRCPFVDREISLTEGTAGASRAAPDSRCMRFLVAHYATIDLRVHQQEGDCVTACNLYSLRCTVEPSRCEVLHALRKSTGYPHPCINCWFFRHSWKSCRADSGIACAGSIRFSWRRSRRNHDRQRIAAGWVVSRRSRAGRSGCGAYL